MKTLSSNWFIEGSIDFEHKEYILLSYLQQINQHFHQNKLYPDLNDLVYHYNNLKQFKENIQILQQSFPQRLTQADIEAVKITYERIVEDDALMLEIEQIINYALHKMNPALQEGRDIYEFVENHLNIEPIGVTPLYPYEGYMLLCNGDEQGTRVYEYRINIFEDRDEKYRGINTTFVSQYAKRFINTPEAIRTDLIYTRKNLPNPAVYHIESDIRFPLEQTLLPLAKQCLIKSISKAA
jgi:hypothetical protein